MNLFKLYESIIMSLKKTKGKHIMEFILISLFIIIIVAWFSIARDLQREDRKRETIQKIFEDSF